MAILVIRRNRSTRSRPAWLSCLLLPLFLLLAACSSPEPQAEAASAERASTSTDQSRWRILVLGDSLSAGFGLSEEEAYPARLEERLRAAGIAVQVINAGVSGDTLADGLSRLPWLLRQEPDLVFVALGANDGLRGLSLQRARDTLRQIVAKIQRQGAGVVIAGMDLPSNYGDAYRREFRALFPEVAAETAVPLLPFLLEGVAMRREYNQADGIHPNAQGQAIIAETVSDFLLPLLEAKEGP